MFAATACVFSSAAQPELVEGPGLLVLQGATLIDGAGAVRENGLVVLQGDRILKVGQAGHYRWPTNTPLLDVKGRYIIPGFIDTHVHSSVLAEYSRTLLAFGITTARSPGNSSTNENGIDVRARLKSGELLGPTLLTTGSLIDHPANLLTGNRSRVETEDGIRAEVRRQAERGVDAVKLYMGIPADLLRAAIDEAHARGIKVIAHLHRTSWTEAAEAGVDGLMHSGSEGPIWELLDGPDAQARFPFGDFGGYLRAWATAAETVDLRGARVERLLHALVANRVEVNPTLVTMESLYWGDDPASGQRLEPNYAPTALRNQWGAKWEEANPFMRQWNVTETEWRQLKRAFESTKAMVRLFHERGVLLTAGTDEGMPWITPGPSFHRELELLVSTGISAQDALVIGTRNGARALGVAGEVGTIEAGKRADLVILRADPRVDIRNTREIDRVVVKGKVYAPAELLRP